MSQSALARSVGALFMYAALQAAHAQEWLPIGADELAMTEEPKAPRASAVYLYRQVDRNDRTGYEDVYVKIKILTEEGRKYADVAIPYVKNVSRIRDLQARTIRPDGSIVSFDGTTYDNLIAQTRRTKILARTFTLPDVQVGSIIEYRYGSNSSIGSESGWTLSTDLFTKHAKFSLLPMQYFKLRYSWPLGLPPGTAPPANNDGLVSLETRDVPAFVEEEFAPPDGMLKYRVDFVYVLDGNKENDPEKYWKEFAKSRYEGIGSFIGKPSALHDAVSTIVSPGDSAETKLRKIYARAQKIRNLSYERSLTEAEQKRQKLKEVRNISNVWKYGYGDKFEVSMLFLGLVRAAGFEAYPVMVSTRDSYFFSERVMNPWQLNSLVVLVNLEGKQVYLNPGTAFAPFGALPWEETGVKGLWLDTTGGSWIQTPMPAPSDSRTVRQAQLRLSAEGSIDGKVTITYTGQEALWRRILERHEDDIQRKEFLEGEVKDDVASDIEVRLTNQPDWTGPDSPLVAEYEVKIPDWATRAGQRMLLGVGLFGKGEKNMFTRAVRTHPLYFPYPNRVEDDIAIELPQDWEASAIPQPHLTDRKIVYCNLVVEQLERSIRIKRELHFDIVILESKFYPQLRDFFQTVRTADEQQVVITPGRAAGSR